MNYDTIAYTLPTYTIPDPFSTNYDPWSPNTVSYQDLVSATQIGELTTRVNELEIQLAQVLKYMIDRDHNESEEVCGHIDEGCKTSDLQGVGGVSTPKPKGTWRWPSR